MRSLSLVFTLLLLGCHQTDKGGPAAGDKVVLGAGDDVTLGSVRVEVVSAHDDALMVRLYEGARKDTRHVTGIRDVKFGAHRVRFEETGDHVAVTVRAYKAPSPLTSDDALLAADEAMSPKSSGPVDCKDVRLTDDGKAFTVRCRDSAVNDSDRTVTVDAVTGAIVSI